MVRWYYRRYVPGYIEKADTVIAVSESTKSDILTRYGTSAEKVKVLHNGCNGEFVPLVPEAKQVERQKWTGGVPYFLFVSALHPRKNVTGVLRAFEDFKEQYNTPHKLVIAGRKAWGNADMERQYARMRHREDIVFTGHLDRHSLSRCLAATEALLYPSFLKASGCPCWKPCTARCRSSPQRCPLCPKWPVMPPCWYHLLIPGPYLLQWPG